MRIIVDAMGGDNAPFEIVKGAVMAAEKYRAEIVLCGNGEEILRSLEKMGISDLPKGLEIANATEVVEMEDNPSTVMRAKPDSSMVVGLKMLKDGTGDAFVSAGSTGALLACATFIVKRISGIRRAALAPVIPTAGDTGTILIDCGANAECTPDYLLQFAYMGKYYAQSVLGIDEPRIALLNIGTEETKGTDLQRQAYALLREAGGRGELNFIGNIEAREVAFGECDVVVTDGYSGNILLKAIEGYGTLLMKEMKAMFLKSGKTKIAAALLKDGLDSFKSKYSASGVGGTAMLGISKPVIKAHGSSKAEAVCSAIGQAINTARVDVPARIKAHLETVKGS